jgi:heteromeric Ino2p/Ino4p transcription factor
LVIVFVTPVGVLGLVEGGADDLTEQKRRQAIREGFDRLTELVPGLEGQGRSESVVLKKTVDFMRAQLAERRRLVGQIEETGGQVEEGMRR